MSSDHETEASAAGRSCSSFLVRMRMEIMRLPGADQGELFEWTVGAGCERLLVVGPWLLHFSSRYKLGGNVKKTPLFLGSAIALTLLFYLLVYYLLPGGAPSGELVVLLAGAAVAIVWAI